MDKLVFQRLLIACTKEAKTNAGRRRMQKDLDEDQGTPEYLAAIREALAAWRRG